jgi:hypothetical protein
MPAMTAAVMVIDVIFAVESVVGSFDVCIFLFECPFGQFTAQPGVFECFRSSCTFAGDEIKHWDQKISQAVGLQPQPGLAASDISNVNEILYARLMVDLGFINWNARHGHNIVLLQPRRIIKEMKLYKGKLVARRIVVCNYETNMV